MSNLSRQCCCGEPSLCSAFCCASSYAVSNFTIPYIFEKTITGTSGVDCGQGYCFRRSYQLNLTITKDRAFVVTKFTLPSGDCCYRGTGIVTIAGTLMIEEAFEGISICPPPYNVPYTLNNSYTFEWDVCACITVTCKDKIDGCNGTTAPALYHSLEIGDFVIVCNHEGIEADCDSCPTPYGPFELRSVGARHGWSSSVACLPSVANKQCLGWWPPTDQLCGSGETFGECFDNLVSNIVPAGFNNGPFGMVLRPECSAGQDDDPCLDIPLGNRFLPTINFGEPAAITNELKSPCANVDTDYNPCLTINVAVRQQGGCPAFWNYT